MMQLGNGKDAGRPSPTLYYRDYIKSAHWEIRKQQYYSRHAKACRICGDTDRVELNHIKYGNYGREEDRDLVPLCRTHHQAFHDLIGVRGNMRYQAAYFLEDMIKAWDAAHEKPVSPLSAAKGAGAQPLTVYEIVDRMARPIWKIIDAVLLRK